MSLYSSASRLGRRVLKEVFGSRCITLGVWYYTNAMATRSTYRIRDETRASAQCDDAGSCRLVARLVTIALFPMPYSLRCPLMNAPAPQTPKQFHARSHKTVVDSLYTRGARLEGSACFSSPADPGRLLECFLENSSR
jgi:hypothetical protein